MYGGEDVSALVYDVGSYDVRAGFAGEDVPKAIFPSMIGVEYSSSVTNEPTPMEEENSDNNNNNESKNQNKIKSKYVGYENLMFRRDNMEVEPILREGIIDNWDHWEQAFSFATEKRLRANLESQPILVTEPPYNTRSSREQLVQHLFEKFQVPAVYLAKSPVLAAFAGGKSTALVVESGHQMTCVTPVHDGLVLNKAVVKSNFAGHELSQRLHHHIERDLHKPVKAHYMFDRRRVVSEDDMRVRRRVGRGDATPVFQVTDTNYPNTTASYADWAVMGVVNGLKQSALRVSETYFDAEENANIPSEAVELPDGSVVNIGTQRFAIPELMFTPSAIREREHAPATNTHQNTALHSIAVESIHKCNADMRKDMYATTILCGGNTLFPGLPKRFEKELWASNPSARVRSPVSMSHVERRFAPWIGGSILASLGTFHQMWFSRSEYEEFGASYVHQKCN
eukprot:gb/GECH01013565.1/.p1 GENE.gb/GECH01013565.1/~~gb/GECH01013565.1/.p1  ORF type:complete len:455 (+),score=99.34 gb/GECH01013565.1/:1-1365(+)